MLGEQSILLTMLGDKHLENRILDYLFDKLDGDVSIPDISNSTNIPTTSIYRIMEELQDEEVVEISREIGRIKLFRLNKNHERVKLWILAERLVKKELEK